MNESCEAEGCYNGNVLHDVGTSEGEAIWKPCPVCSSLMPHRYRSIQQLGDYLRQEGAIK